MIDFIAKLVSILGADNATGLIEGSVFFLGLMVTIGAVVYWLRD